ncbi:MAG: hypothetical protein WC373_10895 [Smithella sp.]|jgi:hypothetical protein
MQQITESFLQVVAADIEKLLLEDQGNIAFAYQKIPDGIKLSIGINLDPSSQGIVVNYDFGFDLEPKPEPPEKHKVKMKHTINEAQSSMEFLGKRQRSDKQ